MSLLLPALSAHLLILLSIGLAGEAADAPDTQTNKVTAEPADEKTIAVLGGADGKMVLSVSVPGKPPPPQGDPKGDSTAPPAEAAAVTPPAARVPRIPSYKKLALSREFLAEGAHYGDFNKDGHLDVVAGPYWYEGPDFTKRHEIYPPKACDPEQYSDNFVVFGIDLNGDGWTDVFVCPIPGTQGYWFENPRGEERHWKKHMFPNEISNETQWWVEIVKGAGKSLLYNRDGFLGFSTLKIENNAPLWKFHAVSKEDRRRFERYTHGIGCGDINGDGRADIVEKEGWWEQPENPDTTPWPFQKFKFSMAGAQMHVFDVDGDGLNDVVTAWHCHLYGLIWWKQTRDAAGKISWIKNEILPIKPDLQSPDLRISQMHSLEVADINGDGLPDLITGKRYWAHGPTGDREAYAPAVLYWFELKRDGKGGATFVPHKIDDDSGVGTQTTAVDLNGDGVPDILVSNKKGTFIFLSEPAPTNGAGATPVPPAPSPTPATSTPTSGGQSDSVAPAIPQSGTASPPVKQPFFSSPLPTPLPRNRIKTGNAIA